MEQGREDTEDEEESSLLLEELRSMRDEGQHARLREAVTSQPSYCITSLDAVPVTCSDSDTLRTEGNQIIHYGSRGLRHCFIGSPMQSVCLFAVN